MALLIVGLLLFTLVHLLPAAFGTLRGSLIARLGERYPDLAPHLEEGIAVAIDGEIFQDALFAAIRPDSEVHVIPKIAGG